jgi:RNA polymerase sigma factor (sigma-70 family)
MLKSTQRVKQAGVQAGAHGVPDLTVLALFDTEESALLRFAFSLIGRRAVAEEIVQDVFLQLHAKWEEIDSPRAWLFRSVRNRAYNYIRDNKREVHGNDNGTVPAPDTETVEAMLIRIEATDALRQILAEVDESDRELIELKYFQNFKYRDISEQTGLTISNVGYRLHHILKELAAKLRLRGVDGIS